MAKVVKKFNEARNFFYEAELSIPAHPTTWKEFSSPKQRFRCPPARSSVATNRSSTNPLTMLKFQSQRGPVAQW
jgi:hypothetical protein